MKKKLFYKDILEKSYGKAILIGEHSVVYGYPALATALSKIPLEIKIKSNEPVRSWTEAWHVYICEEKMPLNSDGISSLNKAFEKALNICGFEDKLASYAPGRIEIKSQIPLGGGLGGSAAISYAFLKIAQKVTGKVLCEEDEVKEINSIDSIFHSGKASGLDAAAIKSGGLVYFQKDKKSKKISLGKKLWLVLVDSGERSRTADMINQVTKLIKKNPIHTKLQLQSLGKLVEKAKNHIEQGSLSLLGECLNKAQSHLRQLNLSTKKVENIIHTLLLNNALGAKITGGGGGGLVMSIFENKPEHLIKLLREYRVFILPLEV